MKFDRKEFAERIITAAFFMGIFFPVRVLFYNYVSDYWLGSFGVMSAILITLLYLNEKKRLGVLGRIVSRHVKKFARGKIGIGIMVSSVFILYFFGNMIYGIETASIPIKSAMVQELQSQGVQTLDDIKEQSRGRQLDPVSVILGVLFLMMPNPVAYSVFGIVNDMTHGWVMHFATVFFVEQLEVVGLIIYFRYFRKTIEEKV